MKEYDFKSLKELNTILGVSLRTLYRDYERFKDTDETKLINGKKHINLNFAKSRHGVKMRMNDIKMPMADVNFEIEKYEERIKELEEENNRLLEQNEMMSQQLAYVEKVRVETLNTLTNSLNKALDTIASIGSQVPNTVHQTLQHKKEDF